MITVEQAWQHVRDCSLQLASTRTVLSEALGLHLDESVVSEVDSPAFDKSIFDGYAFQLSDPAPILRVIEQVEAGRVAKLSIEPGTAIRLMTGAPIPEGADAVIKHENVEPIEPASIRLPTTPLRQGAGILRRGSAFSVGQTLLETGVRLRPIDIALLAESGQAEVTAIPRPRVGVLPTGDELVAGAGPLAASQIRNSNGPMLLAALEQLNLPTESLGIGRDDPADLRQRIERGLTNCDVLLISGGVSAGVKDLVPGVLDELGVRQVFHKVRMKPGKPLWFGLCEQEGRRTLVFGLPGNPVSTLVTFELFVKPALRKLAGESFEGSAALRCVLTESLSHRGGRPTYHPCRIEFGQRRQGMPSVVPSDWRGSADLMALARANALAILPAGDYQLDANTAVDVMAL